MSGTDTDGMWFQERRQDLYGRLRRKFPPYGYMDDNGEYVGFDLELAEEVCKRNGWELVKRPIDWNSKDMELTSGNIDCIWNGFTMNGREDEYTWSDPYIDNSQVFVVAKDSGIATMADLAGKAVGVQADSSALSALNEEDNSDLKNSFASDRICRLQHRIHGPGGRRSGCRSHGYRCGKLPDCFPRRRLCHLRREVIYRAVCGWL